MKPTKKKSKNSKVALKNKESAVKTALGPIDNIDDAIEIIKAASALMRD